MSRERRARSAGPRTSALLGGLVLLASMVALTAGPSPVAAAAKLQLVKLGTFTNPVYVTAAPGEPDLLFVVDRPGEIEVLRNEQPLSAPFLDIRDIVLGSPDPDAGNEQGLLSVAFPPDYDTSGRFYVDFTNNDGSIEIDEFQRSATDPTVADPSTRRVLLVIPHPGAQNHNAGQLQFDAAGRLYISTGDGGNVTPRGENARDLDSLLGKILRINPLPFRSQPYRVPVTNPFVGRPGRDEIYAYGLRNPWRFSFDGGRMAIGDAGQAREEEVDFLRRADAAGVNFGWPQYEGDLIFDDTRPGPDPPVFPMLTYDHTDGSCAIVGGYVVRDPDLPTLQRRYLYGDTCTGVVSSFIPDVADNEPKFDRPTGVVLPRLSSFGQGAHGRIYMAAVAGASRGVYRLEPASP